MRLKEFRQDLGLTQKQLGKLLGVTGATVSKWEKRICYPKLSTLINLSIIFRITINELFSPEDIEGIITSSEQKVGKK